VILVFLSPPEPLDTYSDTDANNNAYRGFDPATQPLGEDVSEP